MKTPRYNQLDYFYGDPRDSNDPSKVSQKWYSENITYVITPYKIYTSWDDRLIKKLAVHKLCAESLEASLVKIGQEISELDRKRYQLDRCGGTFNYRPVRGYGLEKLSVHSYGAAIDLAPALNRLGQKYDAKKNMMPLEVVEIFKEFGASWGGMWTRPDAQHFQFCDP